MIGEGSLAERTKAITDELHAMKSLQNMGVHGMIVSNKSASWSGHESGGASRTPLSYWTVTFTPDDLLSSTPLALLGYSYTDTARRKWWYPAWVSSSSSSKIEWKIASQFINFADTGRDITLQVQVVSLASGTVSIRKS